MDMEDMRRLAYTGIEPAYHYTGRGYCPVCAVKSDYGLDGDARFDTQHIARKTTLCRKAGWGFR